MYICKNCNNKQDKKNNGFCIVCGDNISELESKISKKPEMKIIENPVEEVEKPIKKVAKKSKSKKSKK